MEVIQKISELRNFVKASRARGLSIGLVPTMGYLHAGHVRLVEESFRQDDLTIVSIFVNPLQFNNADDLMKYPRSQDADIELLSGLGVKVTFVPADEEVYRDKPVVSLSFGELENKLEGAFRPGHFKGVGLVISKLFNYVQPDRAYFGLKDIQQYCIIRQLVKDLSFPVEVVGVPTVRTESGLALSSRNARLSPRGLEIATQIYQGLEMGKKALRSQISAKVVKQKLTSYYQKCEGLEIEYIAIINPNTFDEIETLLPDMPVAICVAAYVEGIRLIDNLYLRPETAV